MYSLLIFALRQRFTGYVINVESAVSLALRILYIAILLVNAAMVGWLIDVFAESDTGTLTTDELIHLISVGFCGFWLLMEFFPTYTQRSKLIPSVFPLRFMERWSINLMYDTLTATTTGTIVGFCLMDALSRTYTHANLANSLLLFANTISCIQLVKAFVEAAHHKKFLLLALWVALFSVVILLVIYQPPKTLLLTGELSLTLLGLIALLAYTDRSIIDIANAPILAVNVSLFKQLSPVYTAFLNNSKSRSAFGLGLALKTAFLLYANNPFMPPPMGDVLQILYISPVILFTYVANNIWGFFPALWVNTTMGKRSYSYRIYFQLIGLPIILDLISTFLVVLFTGKMDIQLVLFYALSTVTLSTNGLFFSLYKGFYVKNSMNFGQMKNNVNGWSMLIAAIIIGVTILAVKALVTTILFAIGLAAGVWYLFNQFLPYDTDNTHSLYKQLFIDQK